LPAKRLNDLLIVLIAVTIVVSLQTLGVALMVAMLITPSATAFLLTKRLPYMMVIAAWIAIVAGVTGLYASYYLSIASGSAIVLVATIIFGFVWIVKTLPRKFIVGAR
jgi:ABC-type Mn2+/Zn2+ transport system permease subunit